MSLLKLLHLLPLLPLILAAPLPLLDLNNPGALDGILDPLLGTQNFAVPLSPIVPGNNGPAPATLPLSTASLPALDSSSPAGGGLLDGLLDTLADITGPLNISLGLNTTLPILGTQVDLGLNVQLGDDESLICGPVNGIFDSKTYNVPCACWSDNRGIVIDAQLGIDIGLGQVEGLEAFLKAQIQFGGHQFTYPAYSVPTCDGSGGFKCPGGRSVNGKCLAFLPARPPTRPAPSPGPAPGPTGAPSTPVPTATDLVVNAVPPTTLAPTATDPVQATLSSTPPGPFQGQSTPAPQEQGDQGDDQPVQAYGVTTTTSMSTQTVVLPATVFVEMITTTMTDVSTVYATVTQTQTQTRTTTATQTQTQTQWATTTVSACNANDGAFNAANVPQSANGGGGYTPPAVTPGTTSADITVQAAATPAPTSTPSTGSSTTLSAAPTPTPGPTSSGPAPSGQPGQDPDDVFGGPQAIDLSHPHPHPAGSNDGCPTGQVWAGEICCRPDQINRDGQCVCNDGFENILDLCLKVCIGSRLPSGECSDLGLGLNLGVGIAGIDL
ncbi:hypothetical protein IAU60_000215 [Kwoniella sp. DSM 27419]